MEFNQLPRNEHGQYDKWTWPGGYPIYYLAADSEPICADCANLPEFRTWDESDLEHLIVASDINWETTNLVCANCDNTIESAYAYTLQGDDRIE